MKTIILSMISFFTISIAQADWIKTAVIVSALESGSQQVIQKDKYSEMIDVIRYKLPRDGFYASVEFMEFDIPKADQEYFLSYFKNAGYKNVSVRNEKLYFDYTGHSSMRKKLDLEEKEFTKKLYLVAGIVFVIGLLIFIVQIYVESKAKSILDSINNKILEKAQKSKEPARLYSIERFSLKEKYDFIKKYGPILDEIERNNKKKINTN